MTDSGTYVPPQRVIYGPCPVCNDWQLDVPYPESLSVVEALIASHDANTHPGALAALGASMPRAPREGSS